MTKAQNRAAACEAMDIAITSGQLKELRRQLRNLTRQRLRQQRAELQTWTPLQHIQLKAVVMLILSEDTKWPIFYVKRWQWGMSTTPLRCPVKRRPRYCNNDKSGTPHMDGFGKLYRIWTI